MKQWFCNLWWSLFPSVNINVYYGMMDDALNMRLRGESEMLQAHWLHGAYVRCTPREQAFLINRGVWNSGIETIVEKLKHEQSR